MKDREMAFICAHASSSVFFRNGTSPAGSPGYPPLADVLFDALALDEVAAPMWLELSLAVIVRPPFVIVRIGASTASLFFGASSSFLVISAAVCLLTVLSALLWEGGGSSCVDTLDGFLSVVAAAGSSADFAASSGVDVAAALDVDVAFDDLFLGFPHPVVTLQHCICNFYILEVHCRKPFPCAPSALHGAG